MSALMDQVYESEAASRPSPSRAAAAPFNPSPTRGLEACLIIVASLAIAGLVFGFALGRFGWAGLLIATWPAFALAGGFGCLCHDQLERASRPRRRRSRADAA